MTSACIYHMFLATFAMVPLISPGLVVCPPQKIFCQNLSTRYKYMEPLQWGFFFGGGGVTFWSRKKHIIFPILLNEILFSVKKITKSW